ncbi:MAG: ATP synthase F1 subunit delta [Bacteroidales bacterium]|nr:ATP synthase F1 subunit delta [Bacteroidales bacterium]
MNESQISVRYAKALFQSAAEQKLLDEVYQDMEVLSSVCKLEDFQYMLTVPSLQPSQKIKLTGSILGQNISRLSISMINLVIRNKREIYLPGIARYFRDLYRKEMGVSTVTLLTAQPVDDATMTSIRRLIKQANGGEVELSSSVDEDLIGGFVLTIEDKRYDASVATSLKKMKKQLLQTSIEK